jgi:hypothetical protein
VHAGDVDAVERRLDADRCRFTGAVGDLGRVQQCLGGDAAAVEAGAAELVLLDDDDALAELSGPEGARVPTASAAEDDDVVRALVGHRRLLHTDLCASHGRVRNAR